MPPPHRAEALSDGARLTSDVCLSRTSGLSREQRGLWKTKIGIEVAHVTRDSDTTFKVKRSKVNLQGAGHIVAACGTACCNLESTRKLSSPCVIFMRPSSLGGGRIFRRTLSVHLSVRPVIVAIGNVFSSTASVTDVLFGTH